MASALARHAARRGSLAEGELVVDPALGVGQGLAGATPAELDQLGRDGHRGLLGRPGPEVQPDRRPETAKLAGGQAGLAEPGQPRLCETGELKAQL